MNGNQFSGRTGRMGRTYVRTAVRLYALHIGVWWARVSKIWNFCHFFFIESKSEEQLVGRGAGGAGGSGGREGMGG